MAAVHGGEGMGAKQPRILKECAVASFRRAHV